MSPPTSGYLRILGRDPLTDGPAIRARLGVVAPDLLVHVGVLLALGGVGSRIAARRLETLLVR